MVAICGAGPPVRASARALKPARLCLADDAVVVGVQAVDVGKVVVVVEPPRPRLIAPEVGAVAGVLPRDVAGRQGELRLGRGRPGRRGTRRRRRGGAGALVCSLVRMRSMRRVEPVDILVALLAILAVALVIL